MEFSRERYAGENADFAVVRRCSRVHCRKFITLTLSIVRVALSLSFQTDPQGSNRSSESNESSGYRPYLDRPNDESNHG